MRVHTFLLFACLVAAPGTALAQVKAKPDPKPLAQTRAIPYPALAEYFNVDVHEIRAGIEMLTTSLAAIDATAIAANAELLADRIITQIDPVRLKADAAFIASDMVARFDNVTFDFGGQQPAPRHQTWYQEDPADSLYRAAYGVFGRQQYRQAAERFAEVRARFPNTRYFCDAAYYEAFSRYRLGTQTELRTAHQVLDGMGSRCSSGARRADVPQLTARINSALARLGDDAAAERVRRAAREGQNVCDTEERDVRIQALSALAQMDPANASTVLRDVLNSKDACSAPIRRQAIQLVARRNDQESVALLGRVARTDPSHENQLEAVRVLGRVSNEAAYNALDDFFRNSSDERVQLEAARSMARSTNPRAQATVRTLVERNDVAERIRVAVIGTLGTQPGTSVDYWRGLYGRLESDELRSAVLYAIARNDSDEAQQFLIALAKNPQESYAAREAAISRIGQTAPINELYRMISSAETRSMRLTIVRILAGRREAESTDRLIDIAKTGTDPEVRRAAIQALSQGSRKDDPRVIRALGEIISKGGSQ